MRRGAQRGFTLLELLITLSITTIGLIGLLALHLSIARGNDGASRSADAQQVAAGELESLRSMRIGDLALYMQGAAALTVPTPVKARTAVGRTNMTFNVASQVLPVSGASASLVKIRTTVTWTEDGGTFGANAGQLDHALSLEVIRTLEEAL
ncbi:MAG TPA: prepilin-type N-terminal cleavage/methylation domain-containing protein [Kofleriaceae bacterium]